MMTFNNDFHLDAYSKADIPKPISRSVLILLGNGKLEIKELMDNLDVINMHSLYGDDLMHAFKYFADKKTGFIR